MGCWKACRGLPACEGEPVPLLDTYDGRQADGHSCGAVAFDVLHRFHHGSKAPRWTRELPDPARGMGADTLELLVRRHFGCVAVGHWDIPRLAYLTTFTPVLCLITVEQEQDHWVCVRGVTPKYVHYACPTNGRERTHRDLWDSVWVDATAGGAWRRFGLTGWPGGG